MIRERHGTAVVAAATVVLITLVALVAVSPRFLLYDERYYMESAWFLAEHGSFAKLMATNLDLAAGPLYAYLHVALSPLTGLQPPAIRFVNVAALIIAIAAVAAVLRRQQAHQSLARAVMLLAVPMIGPTSGLALTELPALALAAVATAAGVAATESASVRQQSLWWLLSGVCAGLAVLARQTYFPAVFGYLAVGLVQRGQRAPCLAAFAAALLVVAPMLLAWGGLAPPWQESIKGVSVEHGVLAFVYLSTAVLLIAPGFLLAAVATPRARAVTAAVTVAGTVAMFVAGVHFDVGSRVIAAFPAVLQPPLQLAATFAMTAVAAALAAAALFHAWERRGDGRFLLYAGLTVGLTGTAAGIAHQFSSRYVLAAFPFALLTLQPWLRTDGWAAARLTLGAALGFSSLASYYWNAPPTDPSFRLAAPAAIVARMPLPPPDKKSRESDLPTAAP